MRGLILALVTCAACNNECEDPRRVSGEYLVFGTVREYLPAEQEDLRTEALFYNGERTWELRFVPASGTMSLVIDGQELVGSYEEAADNCNRLYLHAPAAAWVADVTRLGDPATLRSSHVVDFEAELVWVESGFQGTYTAYDVWSMNTGESGTIDAQGYLLAETLDPSGGAE